LTYILIRTILEIWNSMPQFILMVATFMEHMHQLTYGNLLYLMTEKWVLVKYEL